MKRKKKVLISGYYGFDNSGDDAILKAIVKDLKDNSNNIDITAFSNNPSSTEKIYGIKAVNRFSIGQVNREIKDCDLFISGGGSLLQDVTSTRSILYYLALMQKAKKYNKPIMVYANGIGPINKKINRCLTRKILNKVDLITLRDYDSKRTLEEIGVENPNIFVTADPVFTLLPSDEERVNKIFKEENIPMDKALVGVSIRSWKDSEKLIDVLPMAIDYMMKKYDANVVMIPMHYPSDLKISYAVKDRVTMDGCYVLSEKYSVEDIMGVIGKTEIMIAMRLHSLIYAATQWVPMIGIIYDPKIEGILKLIHMDYMCSVDNLELKDLCSNIDIVWSNKDELKLRLKKYDADFKEKALKNVHMALELLDSR